MIIEYEPKGVCSKYMKFDVEDGIIRNFEVIGGCHGNLQGIAALIKGMKAKDVIDRFEGINCRGRGTSCPDQIARALKQALQP